ncbi:hypothetical protein [Parabacteroides johnsonii]|jgi:hypothetical protein|uniref:hypothetical protein n=1 Tax=Parabacteroides johnsonii TaxID=387661 RepID=UPI00206F4FBF|nr:hypothetical protein [Parabacteroides johnsonii]DAI59584.1 MAG TPA: hypothetical protein [Caudoviricetes sp.]
MDIVITKENINRIKSVAEKMEEQDIVLSCEDLSIDDDDINVSFPDEYDTIIYDIADFLVYIDDLQSIKKVNQSTVRSSLVRQSIISVDEFAFDKLNMRQDVIVKEGICRIRLVSHPFLIGYINSIEGNYDDNYGLMPCSLYHAVEIIYEKLDVLLPEEEEDKLLKSALFYWSTKYSQSLTFGTILTYDDLEYQDEDDDGISEICLINIEEILPYSPLMDMYVEAMGVKDLSIKFLYFYKMIEYISPLVAKRRSYELLSQKLDLPYSNKQSYKYLESIFVLTREYDISLKDSELPYTVLNECIDIIQLYIYLPQSIKKKCSKSLNYPNTLELENPFPNEKQNQIKRKVADILYATRNSIVHAKSNYQATGNECNSDDLEQMTTFLEKLCLCLISWNNRQSDLYKKDL